VSRSVRSEGFLLRPKSLLSAFFFFASSAEFVGESARIQRGD